MPDQDWLTAKDVGYDYIKPNSFRLAFHNMPHVSFFCQSSNIPGFTLSPANFPTPFHDLPIAGEKGDYEPLSITFIIDSKLQNFIELRNWLTGLAYPDSNEQFIDLKASGVNKSLTAYPKGDGGESGLYTDATLTILTAKNNPYAIILYNDIWPTSLSGMEFTSTINEIEYLVARATFLYKTYSVEIL